MASMKNLGMIGAGAAGAVALTFGAAGIAGAQEEDPVLVDPTTETDDVDAPDADDARPDRSERRQARIDSLVEDGVITQEQADDLGAVREAIQANRAAMRAEKQAAIADALGITVEDLEAAKEEGSSLADIAGDDLSALVELFTEQATERINDAVESGRITQEQADERLDGLDERIEARLENGGGFGNRGEGKRGHGNRGGEAPAAEAEEASFT